MRDLRWCCRCQRVSEDGRADAEGTSDGCCPHCGALSWSLLTWSSAAADQPDWPQEPSVGSQYRLYDDGCWMS